MESRRGHHIETVVMQKQGTKREDMDSIRRQCDTVVGHIEDRY